MRVWYIPEGRKSNTHEFNKFGHLDLVENTTSSVIPKGRGIADGERVGALHRYFSGLATIQLYHALYFCKGDKIAILKTVACFIKAGYQAFLVLDFSSVL